MVRRKSNIERMYEGLPLKPRKKSKAEEIYDNIKDGEKHE